MVIPLVFLILSLLVDLLVVGHDDLEKMQADIVILLVTLVIFLQVDFLVAKLL